jgi:hypothetical protein
VATTEEEAPVRPRLALVRVVWAFRLGIGGRISVDGKSDTRL